MNKLIFDIETVGVEFESLDETSKETLLKFASNEDEAQFIKEGLGFSPLTGRVVAIGMLNPETNKGAVYFLDPDKKFTEQETDNARYVPFGSEADLLASFWEAAAKYDQFITFNGRTFDNPYLMIRSAINKIKPTKNLMPNRYESEDYGKKITHLDLFDRMTFFGSFRTKGTGLHMWAQAFGVESPKADGVSGYDVARLFKEKEYLKIAQYCFGDLNATRKLYEYYQKYINIK